MQLSLVIARLNDRTPSFKKGGGAADLDAALKGKLHNLPAWFVMPLTEAAQPSRRTGVHSQYITRAFAVVQVLSNVRDMVGNSALVELDDAKEEVRAALIGWVPDPEVGEPVQFTGGRVLKFEDGRLWWSDEFQVSGFYRSTP